MSYTALYRKFRPDTFEEVKGQEHIVTALRNQIQSGRIGHAYLFTGTRGTGKTSVAKVFAKAVNCEKPLHGSPCGECASCAQIAANASVNVVEIDAASNNGVDNIREIREEVEYRPAEGRYKVYIIDEVHMLSIGAFNALLKTLEEPPEYVIFILATTEAHKIPVTILSRCQRYDFRRMTVETLTARISELMKREGITGEEKAIRYIARKADGSMRDGLSLLDQCIAFYPNELLTYENVLAVLGTVDTEMFGKLLQALVATQVTEVLEMVEQFIMQGIEPARFAEDFTWYLRGVLLAGGGMHMEEILGISREQCDRLQEEHKLLEEETLMRYIRVFSDLSAQLRLSAQKRVMLEVALLKLCRPAADVKESGLKERVQLLEREVERLLQEPRQIEKKIYIKENEKKTPPKKKELPKALAEEVKKAAEQFPQIRAKATGPMKQYLAKARVSAKKENQLLLVMPDQTSLAWMKKEEHLSELTQLFEAEIGKAVTVEVCALEGGRQFQETYVDLEQFIRMPIEVEETEEH